ncbi:spindle pole body interacting protein [Nadsonia fulvescens var. elongata DSM 6958]|uniref:Spindle pole body interacting protein n=1 Tax=Nadsonia fulvescens var. elongata DSM 6958 TaxID=857566 RepID=A0A1E3PP19_9ASCO|nr:spindle pole body interacting protein [Nadsonia fulvescens var. elongata DSM 6958]
MLPRSGDYVPYNGRSSVNNSSPLHTDYVLVAEFDLDSGPVVRHQYPEPIDGDHSLMAELMLPDQSHVREEDWTIFFLYKNRNSKKFEYRSPESSITENDKTSESHPGGLPHHSYQQSAENLPESQMYYILNLVNTKFGEGLKRGATVKSMCIVTTHPYFHIFKPFLLLALDEYFTTLSISSLKNLYDAINSMDITLLPNLNFSDKLLLSSSMQTQLFSEKFEKTVTKAPLLNFSGNQSHQQKPSYYIDLKASEGQGLEVRKLVSAVAVRDTHFFESTVTFSNIKIPVKVPTAIFPDSVGDFSLIRLLSTMLKITQPFLVVHPELTIYGPRTPAILVLIYALLTQKRILFVGYNTPSGEVANHVLAACFLVSGGSILRSFTTRAFPYTDLSKVDDLLLTDGYIAGVKNPAFGHHPSWWDIICDVENCTMKISPDIGISVANSKFNGGYSANNYASVNVSVNSVDSQFVSDIKSMIMNHYGETTLRNRCSEYISRFVRIADVYEQFKYNRSALWPLHNPRYNHGYVWNNEVQRNQDLALYSPVIESWMQSKSYKYMTDDRLKMLTAINNENDIFDIEHQLDRLKCQLLSDEEATEAILLLCERAYDYDDLNYLLAFSSADNLFYLAYGLFHKNVRVRYATAEILKYIEDHPTGRYFIQELNRFQLLAYYRVLKEKEKDLRSINH